MKLRFPRTMAAAVAIAAIAWPQVADAKSCSVRSIVGKWMLQIVATETVHEVAPNSGSSGGDVWEETRHIRCQGVTIERAGRNLARGFMVDYGASCDNGNSLTEPPPERSTFLLMRHQRSCTWSMVSELVQSDPEVVRSGVLGTRGGVNIVMFSLSRETFDGGGSFVLGIGDTGDGPIGAGWPFQRGFDDGHGGGQSFRVTIHGVKG